MYFGFLNLNLTTGELKALFHILKGSANPTSPWVLTSEGLLDPLQQVESAIEKEYIFIDYSLPLHLLIFNLSHTCTELLWQNAPLIWIHSRICPKRNTLPYY